MTNEMNKFISIVIAHNYNAFIIAYKYNADQITIIDSAICTECPIQKLDEVDRRFKLKLNLFMQKESRMRKFFHKTKPNQTESTLEGNNTTILNDHIQ